MSKVTIIVLVAVIAGCVQGFPYRENDLPSAVARADWDEVHRLLAELQRSKFGLSALKPGADYNVKYLKPIDGGHVYGESNFEFHNAKSENGITKETSGGHAVINRDGHATEYDYVPKPLQ